MSTKLVESTDPKIKAACDAAHTSQLDAINDLLDVAEKLLTIRNAQWALPHDEHGMPGPEAEAFFDAHFEQRCELETELCDAAHELAAADGTFGDALEDLYAGKPRVDCDVEFVPGPLE
jgi:hypothetical protein